VSRALAAWLLVLGLTLAGNARADERILGFDSVLAIQADGSLDVTETIRVRAEGANIHRGIYRDFPTRYKERFGNRVVVDFQLIDVLRDGHPEPHFTERLSNGVRINTGDDSLLTLPADITYTLHYRTNRQLGFFADHDELYWNVTGLGWSFPIDSAAARVTLPKPVPASAIKLDAYVGYAGAQGREFEARVDEASAALFHTTRMLAPEEGLTIAVSFPKGIVPEPTSAQRWRWFLRDNRGVLVALIGLLALAGFYFLRWNRLGRDPDAGPIFPHYEAPEGFGPGELRMLRRMGNDRLCFTADVVDMAVRGFLQIHGGGKGDWRLVREPGGHLDALTHSQRVLAARLFKEGDEVELKDSEAARINSTLAAHGAELSNRMKPRYYQSNASTVLLGVLASLVIGLIAFLISGGSGIPFIIGLGALGLLLHIVFGNLMKAPTLEGRKLLDQIEGLKMYLGVAERDELASLKGPGGPPALDAKRYEALLPYAMALDVEQAWTKQFTAAVGVREAQQYTPSWYYGNTGTPMGLASLGSSLGSSLSSQISSAATPPGSSSGGGGGGSSGGGGGGGGGGGR
jgi:uncharacterized membrane protein YgcG